MIFRYIFTRKSILIFFLLFAFLSESINANGSNELLENKRDILPQNNNVPVEGVGGTELANDAEV